MFFSILIELILYPNSMIKIRVKVRVLVLSDVIVNNVDLSFKTCEIDKQIDTSNWNFIMLLWQVEHIFFIDSSDGANKSCAQW